MAKKSSNTDKAQKAVAVTEQAYDNEEENNFYQAPIIVPSFPNFGNTYQPQYSSGYYSPQPLQHGRNRFYVNYSPEIECSNMEHAQEVISQMNTMCAQFAQAAIQAGQNGLPNDIVLNFNPKIKFGKD